MVSDIDDVTTTFWLLLQNVINLVKNSRAFLIATFQYSFYEMDFSYKEQKTNNLWNLWKSTEKSKTFQNIFHLSKLNNLSASDVGE